MHLVNGTGNSPSPGQPTPGVVKQDKSSGGSVGTTKTRSDPQRVGMCKGERPIGAAKGKQTMAPCYPPEVENPTSTRAPAYAEKYQCHHLMTHWFACPRVERCVLVPCQLTSRHCALYIEIRRLSGSACDCRGRNLAI